MTTNEVDLKNTLLLALQGYVTKPDADKTEAKRQVILFLSDALVSLGCERDRIFVSGYLGELLCATENRLNVSSASKGYDATDEEGVPYELKITNTGLGNTANVNICPPKKKHAESIQDYRQRLKETIKAKGDMLIEHRYHATDPSVKNTYMLSHKFVAMYLLHKECWRKGNVNIGGVGCVKCTRIHRLDYLVTQDKEYTTETKTYDKTQLDVHVCATCLDD